MRAGYVGYRLGRSVPPASLSSGVGWSRPRQKAMTTEDQSPGPSTTQAAQRRRRRYMIAAIVAFASLTLSVGIDYSFHTRLTPFVGKVWGIAAVGLFIKWSVRKRMQ